MRFVLPRDPLKAWLYSERYLLGGTRSYSAFSGFSDIGTAWQPDSPTPTFDVPCFWIERTRENAFKWILPNVAEALRSFYSPEDGRFLLPIHPASMPLLPCDIRKQIQNLPRGPKLTVSPTASSRTVFVHSANGCPQHFIKLDFPGRISRFIRTITDEDVNFQLWINQQFERSDLPMLPDVGGGYAWLNSETSIGFLVRQSQPANRTDLSMFTVPGFALYGIDLNAPKDPPVFCQLSDLFGGSVEEFLIDRIVVPTVSLWVKIVSSLGIIPEFHGQNVLFCFDSVGSSSSICFRDADMFVDNRRRRELRLECNPFGCECAKLSEKIVSLCFDGFMVHHFLMQLAARAQEHCGVSVSRIRDATVATFANCGGHSLAIADCAYYFDKQLRGEEEFVLRKQRSFKLWR